VRRLTIAELLEAEALELGVSDWRLINQDRIDQFAETTDDRQWIHVQPARATLGPFKGTVAHGYLTLALLPAMLSEVVDITDAEYVVNYGINRLRFTTAVPAGSEIRLRAVLAGAEPRGDGVLLRLEIAIELKGAERPALVGEALFLAL
jgi:acyl dehydratase